jgi:CDP-paratose 2-epimerase
MKILVTGGCGFLGSHVCELFKKKGWDVVAYDNLTKFEYSRVPYFDIEKVRDYNLNLLEKLGVTVVIDDVRNMKMLMKVASGCDFIVHCAAQPAMTIAVEDPQLDFEVNVHGTLNVMECARKYSTPIVNCSTIHVYGTGINDYLKEGDNRYFLTGPKQDIDEDNHMIGILTGTLTPLHASKRAAEIYVQAYTDTYGVKAATFRLTGMYGPRQFGGEDHGWVANFAIRMILGLPIKVFGTDKQVRDILYVKDAAEAFYKWFKKGSSGIYNIGGGEPCITSIRNCLNILKQIIGKEQDIHLEPPRKGDLYYFCCDTRKAREGFGWSPTTLPQEGIDELVKWINENKEMFK